MKSGLLQASDMLDKAKCLNLDKYQKAGMGGTMSDSLILFLSHVQDAFNCFNRDEIDKTIKSLHEAYRMYPALFCRRIKSLVSKLDENRRADFLAIVSDTFNQDISLSTTEMNSVQAFKNEYLVNKSSAKPGL